MNRYDATEIFRTLINAIAKDGRIYYHGRYVELKSSTVRASIKIDDEFDSIKGTRGFDYFDGMKFSDENDFIKSERSDNFALLNIRALLEVYKNRPLRKAVNNARPLSLTPTRLSLNKNNLAVQIIFDDEVLCEKFFFTHANHMKSIDEPRTAIISSHVFQKILSFLDKKCDKIGLRLFADHVQISCNSKEIDILWQLPMV